MPLVPAVENGPFVTYVRGTEVLDFDLMIDEPPQVVDGGIVLPERPGPGFDVDRDFIARRTSGAVDARVPTRS